MSNYNNFVSDFPGRCADLMKASDKIARFQKREVTLMLCVAMPSLLLLIGLITSTYSRSPHHIVAGALFGVFAYLLAQFPIRIIVNKLTIWFGKLSFSVYLIHFAVLIAFKNTGFSELFPKSDLGSILHFMAVASMAALLAQISFTYIEQTGISLGSKLILRLAACRTIDLDFGSSKPGLQR